MTSPRFPSYGDRPQSYEQAIQETWRHTDPFPQERLAQQRELVRYATLAASSHNTQCWTFKLEPHQVVLFPDFTRRCPRVDPEDHHLYISLGCALENLIQAAHAFGFETHLNGGLPNRFEVPLEAAAPVRSPLFDAIPQRQSTRSDYDGQPLSQEDLNQLEGAARQAGVDLMLLTDKPAMEAVLEYVIAGNTAQINDPDFVKELKSWMRFNDREALQQGDGLFSRCSGIPTAPHWLAHRLVDVFLKPKAENAKYARQLRSSAGLAIFVSETHRPDRWIQVGRAYQRFALQATSLGIRTAFLNQPVEVASVRSQLASYLEIGDRRPDLVVRFGRGPLMPRSLRRPLETVLVQADPPRGSDRTPPTEIDSGDPF
ncbi:Acg family FMN-binding oxidoreductase [Lyngbya confervoides]|uniref:Nitroreductase family protein n=1 Tax=Lyngbya confervoides BDU141951 TaxID=1574623 RepID=A0ABD4T658_9CYAN|nr:nitroreductase family protein [Lyngbya confervoides]MCM1984059.1 nitroreductase family protein [Lyngbya confervoides BDU141951]